MSPIEDPELAEIELDLMLQAVKRRYGLDFHEYARTMVARRTRSCMIDEGVATISELTGRLLRDPKVMERLARAMSIQVTSMFRDPSFFLALRTRVLPILATYPYCRIWHAGCSTGEEVYSTAIMLEEEGLRGRCRQYATDVSEHALTRARAGVFPLDAMRENTRNYIEAGGKRSFSDYYQAGYGGASFAAGLREHMVFGRHNLVTDGSFNDFHLILCRNVLIYFAQPLQARVHRLLLDSLTMRGFLGLGTKETVAIEGVEDRYEPVDEGLKIYQRVGLARRSFASQTGHLLRSAPCGLPA